MAIEASEDLFSMLNFGDGTTIHLLPTVAIGDDFAQGHLQHFLDCYAGILFLIPEAVPFTEGYLTAGWFGLVSPPLAVPGG